MSASLVGSEMCIRDRTRNASSKAKPGGSGANGPLGERLSEAVLTLKFVTSSKSTKSSIQDTPWEGSAAKFKEARYLAMAASWEDPWTHGWASGPAGKCKGSSTRSGWASAGIARIVGLARECTDRGLARVSKACF
eukprot:5836501-Alexandrium_andersonii.AAC.2